MQLAYIMGKFSHKMYCLIPLVALCAIATLCASDTVKSNRTFGIDYVNNTFLKDGKTFRYMSGSIHYFRLLEQYWDKTLKKIRLGGFNAITTYIEWQSHQPDPSQNFNFEGNLNVFKFLEAAQKNDLLVILRTGPYMDAERDMGGLPPWLLWQKEDMKLRTSDLEYVYLVSRWFDNLLPRLKPYLYMNGGPIIMLQVENEYGSYFACDKNYTSFIRDLIRFHLGDDLLLFTTDGAANRLLKCGTVPEVYPTVDFGPALDAIVDLSFDVQRMYAPHGPLVNSEYYPGWLDHWENPHAKVSIAETVSTLDKMLSMGANVNIYMVYGGTSFGFGAGSNADDKSFNACPTSYDYDAPISEAGDPTEKYFGIKKAIAKYMPVPKENPKVEPKAAYGKVLLKPFTHILDPEFQMIFGKNPVFSVNPLSFEQLKVGSGFVLYITKVNFLPSDPSLLALPSLKDRAYVYVDEYFAGVLSRTEGITSMPLLIRKGQTLTILVENQGRVCYGPLINESKGVGANVTLGNNILTNWTMLRLGELNGTTLTKYSHINPALKNGEYDSKKIENFMKKLLINKGGAAMYVGNFSVKADENGNILDTFVRLDGFSKGMVYINGFNLGRYWPVVGPQQTLYLPAPLLKEAPGQNTIVVLELEWTPEACYNINVDNENKCFITLTDTHVIDGPTPYKEKSHMKKHEALTGIDEKYF